MRVRSSLTRAQCSFFVSSQPRTRRFRNIRAFLFSCVSAMLERPSMRTRCSYVGRFLLFLSLERTPQSLQFVKTGSTMSDVGKSGGGLELFGMGRQLLKERASWTLRSVTVGVVLMYNPIEAID